MTDKGREIPGSVPLTVFTAPETFAPTEDSDGDTSMDSKLPAPSPTTSTSKQVPTSKVMYRKGTLVFIKPASGSFDRVFFEQLLDPVIEIKKQQKTRGRTTRFNVEKAQIRFFSMDGGDDSRYVHDTTTVKTVNVCRGRATQHHCFV